MPVDSPTLLIAITLVYFSGAVLFLVSWRLFSNRFEANAASLGLWSLSLCLCASGVVLVGLRSLVPDHVSIVLGNALILFGTGMARMAVSSFFERKLHVAPAIAAGIVWLGLCSFPPFMETFLARFLFIQSALAANVLWIALICFRQNEDNLHTARLTGFVTLLQGGSYIYYMINASLTSGSDFLSLLQHDFAKITMLILLFCSIASIILMFAMIIEKDQLFFKTQARHDPLTGLPNRRAFLETIDDWITENEENRTLFAVAKLDVDHFKAINEKYGHTLGDALLQLLGHICNENAGDRVFVGHLSGDRFALFFVGMPLGKAAILTEQIRQKFAKASQQATAGRLKATVSVGLSGGHTSEIDARDALRAADTALSNAKKSGRNRLSMTAASDTGPSPTTLSAESGTPRAPCPDFRRQSKVA